MPSSCCDLKFKLLVFVQNLPYCVDIFSTTFQTNLRHSDAVQAGR